MTAWRFLHPSHRGAPGLPARHRRISEVTEASPRVHGTVAFGRMKELSDAGAT
jgi:hypothetical protein